MRLICFFSWVCLLYSCSPISKSSLTRSFQNTEKKFQDHTGFMLYDPEKKKTLYEYNSDKYFTPASNTKIFTLFASLNILPDSVPALRYVERDDSLIFWGTGDPSFLYKQVFSNNRVYAFLRSAGSPLYFSTSNFHTAHFGSGWAWDDYTSNYSPERSPFPVYGNLVSVITGKDSLTVIPQFFSKFFSKGQIRKRAEIIREVSGNHFQYYPAQLYREENWDLPFHVDQALITDLLSDTLKRPVASVNNKMPREARVLYSIPADSLYRVMMQESDNFIAEQLLMMCAGILTDSLQPEIAIDRVVQNYMSDFTDKPVWVDGSGLSRYNLFTPRTIVRLWEKIYEQVARERLFSLLAIGGKAGTIRNWYKAPSPYIFGKTGSLSNNHCLSGYLVTKSGKTLIFSFMNSNFTATGNDIRRNMQEILNRIYEHY